MASSHQQHNIFSASLRSSAPLPPPKRRPVRRAAPPPAVTHIDAFDSLDRASHRVAVKLFRRLSLERAWLLWLRESTRRHADAERGAVRLRAIDASAPLLLLATGGPTEAAAAAAAARAAAPDAAAFSPGVTPPRYLDPTPSVRVSLASAVVGGGGLGGGGGFDGGAASKKVSLSPASSCSSLPSRSSFRSPLSSSARRHAHRTPPSTGGSSGGHDDPALRSGAVVARRRAMRAALRMWRQRAVERERATRRIRAVRLSDGLIVQRWLRDRTRAFDRWRRGTADRHAAALLSALVAPAKQLRLLHSLSAAVDRWRRLLRDAAARHTHATLVYVLRARRALRRWRVARHLAHRRAEAKGPPRSPAQKEAASALAASTAATVARKQGFALLRRPSEEAAVGAARDRVADGLRLRRSLGTWAVAAVRLRYAGARRTSAMQHASAWHRARPGAALVLRRSLPRWRRAASRLADERSRYRAAADVADAVALSAAVRRWERAAAAAAAAAGAACLADGHMAARRLAPAWRRLAESAVRRRIGYAYTTLADDACATYVLRKWRAALATRACDRRTFCSRAFVRWRRGFLDAVARLEGASWAKFLAARGAERAAARALAHWRARATAAAPEPEAVEALPIADEVRRRLLAAEDLLAALAARRGPVRALHDGRSAY